MVSEKEWVMNISIGLDEVEDFPFYPWEGGFLVLISWLRLSGNISLEPPLIFQSCNLNCHFYSSFLYSLQYSDHERRDEQSDTPFPSQSYLPSGRTKQDPPNSLFLSLYTNTII